LVKEIVGIDPVLVPYVIEVAEMVGVITIEAERISKFAVALTEAKLESEATVTVTVYVPTLIGLMFELA
jgi:hypothetical protein